MFVPSSTDEGGINTPNDKEYDIRQKGGRVPFYFDGKDIFTSDGVNAPGGGDLQSLGDVMLHN